MLSDFKQEISLLNSKLSSAKQILVLIPENPSLDGLASALSLYLTLKKEGKQITLSCPSKLTVEFSDLIGVDEVKSEIGGKNFVISLNYKDGTIEKVSYNIENDKFNLVIKLRDDTEWEVDEKNIEYHKQGVLADLIITVNCPKLDLLGKFYKDEQKIYSEIDIVNIDNDVNNIAYGKINLVSPLSLSLSEFICFLIQDLGLALDKDAATNLLTGIDVASNNLQSENLRAETLEAAASCLKNNGIRILQNKQVKNNESSEVLHKALKIDQTLSQNADNNVPSPDWLAPKIYKGSTLL